MIRSAALTPTARQEAAMAARWLAKHNPAAARELRNTIVEAARLLGARPLAGRVQPNLIGRRYRLWSLAGFPYLLVYDPESDPVQILRVVHTAQDLPKLLKELNS